MSSIAITIGGHWGIAPGEVSARQQDAADRLAARGAALMIEQMIANGQLDTAAMVNSVYVTTPGGSGYGAAAAAARARNPDAPLLDDVGPSEPGTAGIAIAVYYADAQNYGTRLGLAARPFFEPALEIVDSELETALAAAWEALIS
jgi:hypothetical protein